MSTVRTISVIGTGYLGATRAACMADLGFAVIGIDTGRRALARRRVALPGTGPGPLNCRPAARDRSRR